MLWTIEIPEVSQLEKSLKACFDELQIFGLVLHGCLVGTGPTLSSCILASVKQVFDSSFKLLKESVSLFDDLSLSHSLMRQFVQYHLSHSICIATQNSFKYFKDPYVPTFITAPFYSLLWI